MSSHAYEASNGHVCNYLPCERRALQLAGEADAMLVVGSSLMVYSAFKLAKATKAAGSPLALCVVGPTRADDMADLKVEALAGKAMTRLASDPSLHMPRPVSCAANGRPTNPHLSQLKAHTCNAFTDA